MNPATCACASSVPMILGGRLVCAGCKRAPVIAPPPVERAPDTCTSVRLPEDCPSRAAFARACRSGRVRGAERHGRVWVCTREAWAARAPAPRPRGLPAEERTRKVAAALDVAAEVISALGGAAT